MLDVKTCSLLLKIKKSLHRGFYFYRCYVASYITKAMSMIKFQIYYLQQKLIDDRES